MLNKQNVKASNVLNKSIVKEFLKVAVYIRVSTAEQAKEGYSIGEQLERLTKYCEAMGWEIYKVYTDPGYSGGSTDRPALQELIKDVEENKIDKVVVYKLDRLSRSQLDTLFLIEKVFLANDTDFVSMSENFDTSTPFGRAMIGILAVFAQLEREQIKERMNMGKEARAKEGKWGGGSNEPIGYDYDVANDLLVVNKYEAMQIKELCELMLNGVQLRTIETLFNNKGYTHKHGKWTPKTMRRLLRNKIYLGYIHYHNEYYKAEHDPIIDEDTYNKINRILDQRAEHYQLTGVKAGAQTTYLGGLLFCKHCGGRYAKNTWPQRDGSRRKMYGCYSRTKKVKAMIKNPDCKNKHWKIEELDTLVFNEIRKLALNTDYIKELKNDKKETQNEPNRVEIIENKIKDIDEQISRFMDLYGIGKFTIEQVSSKTDPLNETRKNLKKELDSLNASLGKITEEETIKLVNSFEEVLSYGDFEEIRTLIESLIYYIELDNEKVFIHWKFA